MASYDAQINIVIQNQNKLQKLYEELDQVQEKINRIASQKIPQISVQIDRSRINTQLALISQQFRRRDYRLQVNDTAIKSAAFNAKKLQEQLSALSSTKHVIDIEYRESGRPSITGAQIGKKAEAARKKGLSGQLSEILAAGEAAVGGLATADKVTALLSKISKKGKESGGFNIPGLRETIQSLGGTPLKGAKRAELQKQAQDLLLSVDEAVLNAVYDRLIDLKMELKPIRKSGLSTSFGPQAARSAPNLQDIFDRMAFATTRPGTAQGMLRKIPEQLITTDIAELASRQMRYFEEIPLARQTYKEGKYFDPLLKAIAKAFAKYTRSISPMNPWLGRVGTGMEEIISQSTRVSPIGLLPPAGGTSGSRINREMLSGLQPITAPRLGLAEDLRYLRSIQRYIRMANDALGTEAEALIRASGQMPLGSSALRAGRLLPPAGGTGGSAGGGFGGGFGGGAGGGFGGGAGGGGFGGGFGDDNGFTLPPFGPQTLRADRLRRIRQGRARQESIRRATSEGLIGGAFPLLFGQGIGAAALGGAGGAIGGFAGGGLGFGLSLVGTALGTAFDTLSQAAQDTGAALNYPIEGFEKLKEAGLFASRQQEYYISKLIETGRTAEATAKIQARIVEVIGVQGANDLMSLGDSASLLGKKWSELNYQMQALVAGPVGGFLELLAKVAGAKVESNRLVGLGERISQLTPEQRRIFQEEAKKISAADYTKGAEALLDRIAPQQLKQPKEDPAQVERDLNKSIETAEKVRALRQQGTALERNAQDLRLSIEDTVYGLRKRAADMEREAAEFRRSVEDQVFSKRQELEQKLIENDRKRQQNAIDAFDLQLQRASTGLDPIAQGIVDAARQYLRVRAEGEADLQQNERQLKLQLQQIDQEVARYKLQVEDRISQMSIQRDEFTRDVAKTKLQLERQIGDYVIQVEEYRLKMAKHRYELEIDLEKKKQIAAQGGLMGGGGPVDRLMGAAAQREKFVQDQLVRRGFTPEQMAAVMGSVRQESGFNPYAQEQGGTGLGLFQWSFDRRSKVPAFTGNWQKDIQNQLDLFQRELNTTEKKAGEILMGATTLQGAAAGMKQFERYGVAGRRYDYMKDYYTRFTGGAGFPVSQQMEPGFTETFDLGAPTPTAPTAPTIPELPGAPQLVEVNDLLAQYVDLQERLKKALQDNNLAEARRVQLQAESARLAFEQQTLSPIRQFQQQNRELQFEIQKRQIRNRLLAEGVKPEIVEGELRVLEINKTLNSVLQGLEETTNQQVKAELERAGSSSDLVDSTFRLTEATLASLVATTQDVEKQEELRKKLQNILDLRDKLAGKATGAAGEAVAGARGTAAEQAKDGQKIQEFIAQATTELQDLESVAIRVSQGIGDAVGNSIANGISGLIEGTTTAKEVFAGFLKDVGDILIKEGTRMIAMYAAIALAKQLAGLFGGGSQIGKGFEMPSPAFIPEGGFKFPGAANGAYFSNGITAFANGGMFTNSVVSSPTLFQFADGGTLRTGVMGEAGPEAIMPLKRGPDGRLGVDASGSGGDSKMFAAMSRYASGARGSSVIPANGSSGAAGSAGANTFTLETVVINNIEYATVDQVRAMGQQAAKQGATQGHTRSMRTLQNSRSQRSKLGMR